jgi:hypothetical protein
MTCRVCAAAFAILCIGTLTMVGMVPRAGTSPRDRRRKRAKCRTCRNPSCIAPLVTTAGQTNVVRSLTLADISGRGTQLTRILTFKLTACQSTTLASERPVVSHSVDHRAASTNQACVPGTADIEGDWCLRRVLELGKGRQRVPAGWTVAASDRADCAKRMGRTPAAEQPLRLHRCRFRSSPAARSRVSGARANGWRSEFLLSASPPALSDRSPHLQADARTASCRRRSMQNVPLLQWSPSCT